MSSNKKLLTSLLLLILILSTSIQMVNAQITTSQYWVSVNTASSSPILYGTVGKNWTLPFQAIWSYGENLGKVIENATLIVEVKTNDGVFIENVSQITTVTGFATFYYSQLEPDILVFTPIMIITQKEMEYDLNLFEQGQNGLYGLQSNSVAIYWDTFDASLVNTDTTIQGETKVSINATYLLMPEEGLVVSNFSSLEQKVFPKIGYGLNVTINNVNAEETSTGGIYSATFPTWLPSAYVFVEISQDEWLPAHEGFSFSHNSNAIIWIPAIVLSLICFSLVMFVYLIFKKPKDIALFNSVNFPFISGMLLMLSSFIALYWGVVGLDSTFHGFEWIWLAFLGLISFSLGLIGSILSLKKKRQGIVIFFVLVPILTNLLVVTESLEAYQLTIPWLIVMSIFVLSVIGGILICRSDEHFIN